MLTTYRFCVLFLTVFICITITTQKLAKGKQYFLLIRQKFKNLKNSGTGLHLLLKTKIKKKYNFHLLHYNLIFYNNLLTCAHDIEFRIESIC